MSMVTRRGTPVLSTAVEGLPGGRARHRGTGAGRRSTLAAVEPRGIGDERQGRVSVNRAGGADGSKKRSRRRLGRKGEARQTAAAVFSGHPPSARG